MKNREIRQRAKEKGVFLYEVAEALDVSEATINRKLRHELGENERAALLELIEKISLQKRSEEATA